MEEQAVRRDLIRRPLCQLYTSEAADSFTSHSLSKSLLNSGALSEFEKQSLAGSDADSTRDPISAEASRIANESQAAAVPVAPIQPQQETNSASESAPVADSETASTAASEAAAASETPRPPSPANLRVEGDRDFVSMDDEEVPLGVNDEEQADAEQVLSEIDEEEVPLANEQEGLTGAELAMWSVLPLLIGGTAAAVAYDWYRKRKAALLAQEANQDQEKR